MGILKENYEYLYFFMVCWSLWNQRNRVIFEKVETYWINLCYMIKIRLGFWIKGWNQHAPFNPGEVATKLECVKLWKREKEHRQPTPWCLPPPNRI